MEVSKYTTWIGPAGAVCLMGRAFIWEKYYKNQTCTQASAGLPLQKCMRRLFGFLWFRYINGFQRRERERPHCPPAGRERKSVNFECGFIIHYLNRDMRLTRPHFLSENVQAERHQSVTKRVPPQSSKPNACSSFTLLFFFFFSSPGFGKAEASDQCGEMPRRVV